MMTISLQGMQQFCTIFAISFYNFCPGYATILHGICDKFLQFSVQGMQLTEEALNGAGETHGDSHIRPLQVELINLKRLLITSEQTTQDLGESNMERAERIEVAAQVRQVKFLVDERRYLYSSHCFWWTLARRLY